MCPSEPQWFRTAGLCTHVCSKPCLPDSDWVRQAHSRRQPKVSAGQYWPRKTQQPSVFFQSCAEVILLIFGSFLFSIAGGGHGLSNYHFQLFPHVPSQAGPVCQSPEQIRDGASGVPRASASFHNLLPHSYSTSHALSWFSLFSIVTKKCGTRKPNIENELFGEQTNRGNDSQTVVPGDQCICFL